MRTPLTFGYSVVVSALLALGSAAQENTEADRGNPTFSEAGCATCHGPSGRGANGPSLLPMERDFPDFGRVVREGIGEMPPQAEEDVTDEQIASSTSFSLGCRHHRASLSRRGCAH